MASSPTQEQEKSLRRGLLYAVGRQGNVEELNLAAAGLEADSRGRIVVDEDYRTKQSHIFAVGDVIGFPSLGSVSMEQGRIAAAEPSHSHQFQPRELSLRIYTIPEISFIGKTEEQLTDEGIPYEVAWLFFAKLPAARFAATPLAASNSFSIPLPNSCSACISSAKALPNCCTSGKRFSR